MKYLFGILSVILLTNVIFLLHKSFLLWRIISWVLLFFQPGLEPVPTRFSLCVVHSTAGSPHSLLNIPSCPYKQFNRRPFLINHPCFALKLNSWLWFESFELNYFCQWGDLVVYFLSAGSLLNHDSTFNSGTRLVCMDIFNLYHTLLQPGTCNRDRMPSGDLKNTIYFIWGSWGIKNLSSFTNLVSTKLVFSESLLTGDARGSYTNVQRCYTVLHSDTSMPPADCIVPELRVERGCLLWWRWKINL